MKKALMFVLLLVVSPYSSALDIVLCDELASDPLARGYSSMSVDEQVTDLNTQYRTEWKECVDGADLLDAIDSGDWVSITDAQQQQALALLAIGCLDPQKNARTMMIGIFGAGSSTIVEMAEIAQNDISRADELGLPKVKPAHIGECN